MKIKILTIALLAGFLSMGTQADVTNNVTIDENVLNAGAMNVFDLSDGWLWNDGWGIPDLVAEFDDSGSKVTLKPNSIDDPSTYWYLPSGEPGSVGQKKMQAFLMHEETDTLAGQTVTFKCVVTDNTLTNTHKAYAFIRDFVPDYSSYTENFVELTTNGDYTVTMTTVNEADRHVQYGVYMYGVCVWITDVGPYGSIDIEAFAGSIPPAPDPSFAIGPEAIADNKISMSSTTAYDDFSGVEYYFDCITPGGHDSGWQSSTNYVDTGLTPDTLYSYTVQARDTSLNTNLTAVSAINSIKTFKEDTTAPAPDPMSFAIDPTPASPNSIYMMADVAIDTNDTTGVEYYFACTSSNGTDSGWQSSPEYLDWNLPPSTEFSYAVTARDTSSNTNMTAPSGTLTATTPDSQHWMANSLKGYSGDSTQQATRNSLGIDSLEITDTTSTNQAVVFSGSGIAFGTLGVENAGRNVLRTTETNYNASSFDAYATFAFTSTNQNVFVGFGGGVLAPLDVGYGVPDLNADGVDAVFAEFTGDLTKMWRSESGSTPDGENLTDGLSNPLGNHRIRLAYDAIAETATVTVDLNYVAPFVADLTNGTLSTTGLWVAPQNCKVYVGGDDGVVFTDLLIQNPDPDPVVIAITPIAEGSVISWDGEGGQTYDVQYAAVLSDPTTWTTDSSDGCSDILATVSGTISATSTVNEAAGFYQVISE